MEEGQVWLVTKFSPISYVGTGLPSLVSTGSLLSLVQELSEVAPVASGKVLAALSSLLACSKSNQ